MEAETGVTESVAAGWAHDTDGWRWSNPSTGSYFWATLRAQTRYSNFEDDPLIPDDLRSEGEDGFGINRGRLKMGAGIGRQFTFKYEYDLINSRVLDLRATWKPSTYFRLRAGQWKTEFSRERVDSSGNQQFVDRSIANYWFTVDRQNGAMASGRFGAGSGIDSTWWLGVFHGNGLNNSGDGGRPMFVGRYQWNFSGEPVPFTQSALQRHDQGRGALAVAYASNDSAYTRFSSSGGGQLPGFDNGHDNQYRLEQWTMDYSWHKNGFSLQGEGHYKTVQDRLSGVRQSLAGGYLQAGLFPATSSKAWPEPLELAFRAAMVNPNRQSAADRNAELTTAVNWFFNGHRNKLTADVSWLSIDEPGIAGAEEEWRFRVQWDLSL